jgi:hypothetical protein
VHSLTMRRLMLQKVILQKVMLQKVMGPSLPVRPVGDRAGADADLELEILAQRRADHAPPVQGCVDKKYPERRNATTPRAGDPG